MSAPPSPTPPRSILIADDNEHVRRMLVEYVRLTKESEVLEAANGFEALRIVKHQRPEVVLLDLTMPGLGAYETIRQMRRSIPRSASSSLQAMAAVFEANARFLRAPGRHA